MNERAKAYWDRLLNWWKNQAPAQKLRVGGLVVLGLAVLVTGWTLVTSPDWQPLYTNLDPRTAGQITNQLSQMKIPYELTNGGATILVPKKDVNQVRVDLADQNIPSSGTVGLPQPMTFTLGETDQEIQLTQLADLEATLESTINSINGVHSSRVLINEPAPSLFGETTTPATASVFVDLNPGASLSAGQVRGIMNLVAHSVNGLAVNQVTVVDQNGDVLSAGVLNQGPAATISGLSSAELADENQVASNIRNNVEGMLTQVLGPGNAVVQVSATLNFNQSQIQSTQYGKGVLSSQQVQSSTSTQSAAPTTAAGTTGNVPVYTTQSSGGPTSTNSKTVISNYLVDTTKTNETVPGGAIQRLTVAVVVDKKLTAQEAQSLKSLVASAAGIDYQRGDQLTVVGLPFNRSAVSQALLAMQKAQRAQEIRQGVLGLMALLVFLGVLFTIRRSLKNRPVPEPMPAVLPQAVGEVAPGPEPMSVAELLNEMRVQREPDTAEQARQRLLELAKNEPETAARLLKAWMDEESS
ncbi:MAG: flagellar basal-body MS-ring/collar protein FliF [Sulfobacillus sp.]|nr:flagellar basal-body MS-ring/collar protein FliF [Sulfobacillus sp.]